MPTPNILGMIHRVKELLLVEEVEGTPQPRKVSRPGGAKNVKTPKAKPVKAAAETPAKEAKPKAATPKAKVTSEEKPKKAVAKKTEKK